MIVWEAGGVSLENKLVKKPVTEERRLPVCLTGLPVSEAVRKLVNFLNRLGEEG